MNLLIQFKIKTDWKIFFIILGIFILISLIYGVNISFLFTFSAWLILMFYSLKDIKNNILLTGFLTTFFAFLLGGHFVYEYFGMEVKHYLGYEYYLHSNVTMGVSLSFLFIGAKISEQIIGYVRGKNKKKNNKIKYAR